MFLHVNATNSLIMLSKKTKYAIHALTYLAGKDREERTLISEISAQANIPKKFLEAILLDLKKSGYLSSKIGKGGGYRLIKPTEEIRMADLIRMFNGPIALLPCVSLNYYESCDECKTEEGCGLNKMMIQVRDEMLKILEHKSLADLLKMEKNLI